MLGALILVAAALRFPALGAQSLWYDESFTYDLVHHSFGKMLGVLPHTELSPPLYYILEWGSTRVLGSGEAGLRVVSAIAGVLTVPVMYFAVRQLISARAGLVAAALVACNPLLVWYSREARSYALLVLLSALTLLAFAHLQQLRPPSRFVAAWGLTAFLTVATHYYGTLIVVPEAGWLLWLHRRDWRVWGAVSASAAATLGLLPLALAQRPNATWIASWPLDRRLSQIAPQFLLGTGAPARAALKAVGAVMLVVAVVLLLRRSEKRELRGALAGGALACSGFAISLILVLAGVDEVITRNLIVLLLGAIVFLSGSLGGRRSGLVGVAGISLLCVVGVICCAAVMAKPEFQRPDWRGLAHTLQRPSAIAALPAPAVRVHARKRVVIIERYFAAKPLSVYMPGLRLMTAHDDVDVQEVDLIAARAPAASWFCWWGSECNLKRSRLFSRIHIHGFHASRVLRVGQFTILRLLSPRPVPLRRREIFAAMLASRLDGWAMLVVP